MEMEADGWIAAEEVRALGAERGVPVVIAQDGMIRRV
jgi:hypothetical protein